MQGSLATISGHPMLLRPLLLMLHCYWCLAAPHPKPPTHDSSLPQLDDPGWPCAAKFTELNITKTEAAHGDELTRLIHWVPRGWQKPVSKPVAPPWLSQACPEVAQHFTKFPMFQKPITFQHGFLPLMTTDYAAQMMCTLQIVQLLGLAVGAHVYLHAGTHLASVVHGQPIPWDDGTYDLFSRYTLAFATSRA